jgi:Kef-type K+ transport system membrane component KefB
MTTAQFGSLTLVIFTVLAVAHLCGWAFVKLRQPRVVGEILAGVLLGSAVLGRLSPKISALLFGTVGDGNSHASAVVLGFLYNLGLLLLMFASGAETKGLFNRQDTREVAWLGGIGTAIPFLIALLLAPSMPLQMLMRDPAASKTPITLVVSIAIAVTSIPVISKILHDLDILHTRFARLVLGVAVLEDVALWAVLAVATSLAKSANVPRREIVLHVAANLVFFAIGLFLAPTLLKKISRQRINVLATNAPVAYVFLVLLAYSALAALLGVNLVFAAFLAGLAVVKDKRLLDAVKIISTVSFAIFIPIYFAVVGYKLDLGHTFSFGLLAVFLTIACAVKLIAAGSGARIAGFPWRDSINLATALNARGGPGIILASVALDAGIVNAPFYTTLVLVAVLTSQLAGAWLDYVLRKGMPLLTQQELPLKSAETEVPPQAA